MLNFRTPWTLQLQMMHFAFIVLPFGMEFPQGSELSVYLFSLIRVLAILVIAFLASRVAGRLIQSVRTSIAGL